VAAVSGSGQPIEERNPRSRRLLVTTNTLENVVAAPSAG
jgi:hypothetical protein